MKKVAIINGPNLNMLGTREPEIYGHETLEDIVNSLKAQFQLLEITAFQSNIEGELVTAIQQLSQQNDALVINPGAYSHYSIAILDALKTTQIPKVEVHLSNIYQREEFRAKSITAQGCTGVISGFGKESYTLALQYINQLLEK